MDDKRVVNLKIGHKYRFENLVAYGKQWRRDKRHAQVVITGTVVGEHRKFYVIKANSGYTFTMLKHSLRTEVLATAVKGGAR